MLSPGARLGRYEISAPLGAGGMGEVYRARDTELGREIALKVLPEAVAADPDRLKRFEREARTLASLSHPNVLTVFDVGREDGHSYLIFELLEGETVGARLRTGRPSLKEALERAADVARGLKAAHARGIVHRDLKPDNLFLTISGVVKILDFGLARVDSSAPVTEETTQSGGTQPGTVVGDEPPGLEELSTRVPMAVERVVRRCLDSGSATGYKIEPGPFPGWAKVPEW